MSSRTSGGRRTRHNIGSAPASGTRLAARKRRGDSDSQDDEAAAAQGDSSDDEPQSHAVSARRARRRSSTSEPEPEPVAESSSRATRSNKRRLSSRPEADNEPAHRGRKRVATDRGRARNESPSDDEPPETPARRVTRARPSAGAGAGTSNGATSGTPARRSTRGRAGAVKHEEPASGRRPLRSRASQSQVSGARTPTRAAAPTSNGRNKGKGRKVSSEEDSEDGNDGENDSDVKGDTSRRGTRTSTRASGRPSAPGPSRTRNATRARPATPSDDGDGGDGADSEDEVAGSLGLSVAALRARNRMRAMAIDAVDDDDDDDGDVVDSPRRSTRSAQSHSMPAASRGRAARASARATTRAGAAPSITPRAARTRGRAVSNSPPAPVLRRKPKQTPRQVFAPVEPEDDDGEEDREEEEEEAPSASRAARLRQSQRGRQASPLPSPSPERTIRSSQRRAAPRRTSPGRRVMIEGLSDSEADDLEEPEDGGDSDAATGSDEDGEDAGNTAARTSRASGSQGRGRGSARGRSRGRRRGRRARASPSSPRRSGRAAQKRHRTSIYEGEWEDIADDEENEDDERLRARQHFKLDSDSDSSDGNDGEAYAPVRKSRAAAWAQRQLRHAGGSSDETSDPSSASGATSEYDSWTDEDCPVARVVDLAGQQLERLAVVDMPPTSAEQQAGYLRITKADLAPPPVTTASGRIVHTRRRFGYIDSDDSDDGDVGGGDERQASPGYVPAGHKRKSSLSDHEATDSEAEELRDISKQPVLSAHWEVCARCKGPPGWREVLELQRIQARLDRKIDRELLDSPLRSSKKARRSAAYKNVHRYASAAQAQVDEMQDHIRERGAWLTCQWCSASMHTGCQTEIRTKALLAKLNADSEDAHKALNLPGEPEQRDQFVPSEYVQDKCEHCYSTDWHCLICRNRCIDPTKIRQSSSDAKVFRCTRCVRTAHYDCIQQVSGEDSVEEAASARVAAGWKCFDCESWGQIDAVLAWRPQAGADLRSERPTNRGQPHKPSDDLKRDYLVKFKHTSFRKTQWVPHAWLSSVSRFPLRNFLSHGSRFDLEPDAAVPAAAPAEEYTRERIRRSKRLQIALTASRETGEELRGPPPAEPDAQQKIPKAWTTPGRLLDVYFHIETVLHGDRRTEYRNRKRRPPPIIEDDKAPTIAERKAQLEASPDYVHLSEVDRIFLEGLSDTRMMQVMPRAQVLVKWEDLEYEQSTWENGASPALFGDAWSAFVLAFYRHRSSRNIFIKHLSARQMAELEGQRRRYHFEEIEHQPEYVVGGQMLDFQIDGLNWLRYGWHDHQPGILADEMGLGKTVQVIAFVASLHHQFDSLSPHLIVVPNSVVMNWVREFERWCPHLQVVPYYGGHESREIVERYELFHLDHVAGRQDLRADVVICSDSVARLDPRPLKRVQRWQTLVVDEGTSLKAGKTNLLYQRLSSLNAAHRLIMTGTPLNNNIGELFNLLNWLKSDAEWKDIKALRQKYEVLTPELISELQPLLKPYFLRRLKKDVVNLPPRAEILVPVSLTSLQKRVYKDVLEHNVEDIQAITDAKQLSKRDKKSSLGNLMNVLVQLRKACQHPYLIAPTLENFDAETEQARKLEAQRLTEASGKLLLLQKLLPKLKARGRRVLIFSQFVIFLDIVESFLLNEGKYKYLRLDGSFGHRQRQRGIAAFNAPRSEYFAYLLSTRAGGVGINLASADTVIILDSDFNPHIDMQAIARAHRIGQTKKVLVFTLVAKSTAEERIVEKGRKKLVLDQVIHTITEEESGVSSLQDALRHGARALFEEGGTDASERDLPMTDLDVEQLIYDAEAASDAAAHDDDGSSGGGGGLLSFARVWERDLPTEDPTADMAEEGFWASLLEKTRLAADVAMSEAESVVYGRGGARHAKIQTLAQIREQAKDLLNRRADRAPRAINPARRAIALSQGRAPATQQEADPDASWVTVDADADGSFDTFDDGDMSMSMSMDPAPAPTGSAPNGAESQPLAPAKRPRGRPKAAPRPPQPVTASLFNMMSRSLPRPRGRPKTAQPRPPKAPKPPRALKQPGTAAAAAAASASASGVAPPSGASNVNANNIGAALSGVYDPTQARQICFTVFRDRTHLAFAAYQAWLEAMTQVHGSAPASTQGASQAASATPPANAAATSSSSTTAAAPAAPAAPAKKTQAPRRPRATNPDGIPAAPAAPRRSRATNPDGTPAAPKKKGRPRKSAAAAAPDAEAAPAPVPPAGIAGLQQPGEPPLAMQPSILERQPPQGFVEHRCSTAELEKLLNDLPDNFKKEVRMRHAQGPPQPLLVPEARTQLSKTHMAYFSLKLLNYLGGLHPLFDYAFTLVESERIPEAIRSQPFEGAEALSGPVVETRLLETAHYFYAQLLEQAGPAAPQTQAQAQAQNDGSAAAAASGSATATKTTAGAGRKKAPRQSKAQQKKVQQQQQQAQSSQQAQQAQQSQQAQSSQSQSQSQSHSQQLQSSQPYGDYSELFAGTIEPDQQPPEELGEGGKLGFYWLQAVDALGLKGLSKASRMWLLQPLGETREVMGAEINDRLANALLSRRRLGQSIPKFFRQAGREGFNTNMLSALTPADAPTPVATYAEPPSPSSEPAQPAPAQAPPSSARARAAAAKGKASAPKAPRTRKAPAAATAAKKAAPKPRSKAGAAPAHAHAPEMTAPAGPAAASTSWHVSTEQDYQPQQQQQQRYADERYSTATATAGARAAPSFSRGAAPVSNLLNESNELPPHQSQSQSQSQQQQSSWSSRLYHVHGHASHHAAHALPQLHLSDFSSGGGGGGSSFSSNWGGGGGGGAPLSASSASSSSSNASALPQGTTPSSDALYADASRYPLSASSHGHAHAHQSYASSTQGGYGGTGSGSGSGSGSGGGTSSSLGLAPSAYYSSSSSGPSSVGSSLAQAQAHGHGQHQHQGQHQGQGGQGSQGQNTQLSQQQFLMQMQAQQQAQQQGRWGGAAGGEYWRR